MQAAQCIDEGHDLFTREVIKDSLQAICDEMFASMRKAAMSSVIYEVLDFGVGITDAKGQLVCQGNGIPLFVGALDPGVRAVSNKYVPADGLHEGDIFISNDPFIGGGTHLNDVSLIAPIYYENELIAWLANKAHWADIGGMVPGGISTQATEIYQEGLQFPQVKLFDRGTPIQPLLDIIEANSRLPENTLGDLWAGVAAIRVGEKRIQELARKYSIDKLKTAISHFLDYGEALARNAMKSLPKGDFSSEIVLDSLAPDEQGQVIRSKVRITDDEFIVDLSGNPVQGAGPYNCTYFMTVVTVQILFKSITSPDTIANAGFFRPLKVLCDEGSMFAATRPAAVGLYPLPVLYGVDLVWKALAPAIPLRLGAGHYASVCGTIIGATNPRTGEYLMSVEPEPGGWGANIDSDGQHAQFCCVNGETYNVPVEIYEARYGQKIRKLELNVTDAGAGKFRGGRGIILEYEMQADDGFITTIYTRSDDPAWGLDGGQKGSINYCEVIRQDGAAERYSKASQIKLAKGDIVRIVTGTGGGYGAPEQRPKQLVLEDLKNGLITQEAAKNTYKISDNNE